MKKRSLLGLVGIVGALIIISVGVLVVALDIGQSYRHFQITADRMRAEYLKERKAAVKLEVLQAVELIRDRLADTVREADVMVEARAKDAYAIADHIYRTNRGEKSDAEIQRMIVEVLRPARFFHGTGYYFITRLDGTSVLFADRPNLEGKNLLGMVDPEGKSVVRDMIAIASQKGEGFYSYRWTKPGMKGNDFRKRAFIKRFEPYRWFIGTGLYLDDVEKERRKELLVQLSKVRFGPEGYLFVNRYNGNALVSNGKVFSGNAKLWDEFPEKKEEVKRLFEQELKAAQTPDGDYIRYAFGKLTTGQGAMKTSYVRGIPELQWLVGAGFYEDEVEGEIKKMTASLKAELWRRSALNALAVLLVTALFLVVFTVLRKRVKGRLTHFLESFARAAYLDENIDQGVILFAEWQMITDYAGRILSDKRAALAGLGEEKERLSVTLHSIGDAVISTDRSGCVELMNGVAEELTGWKADEAKGKRLTDVFAIVNSITGEKAENPVERVLTQGVVVGLVNHTVLISQNGDEYQIADSAAPIRDREGNITGVVLVFRDVTERYRNEEQLRRSEEELRTIFDAAKNVALIKVPADMQGNILQFSKGAEAIFGYSGNEALGKDVAMLHIPEDVEKFPAVLARMQKERIGFNGEVTMVRKSGERFPALFTTYPLFDADGRVAEVLGVVIDISRQKEAEEEIRKLEKLRSIGTLAGGLAHDFNNILTGFFGNISLARMKLETGSPALPYMEKAEMSLERAKRLTNQLLTFSKGGAPLTEEVNLPELVIETVQFDLSGSNVKAVFEISPDLWNAKVDPAQMHQVFSNLTINAKQAMPEGGLLKVVIENSELFDGSVAHLAAGKYIKITVADQGCGIEGQMLDKVFDPFFTTKEHGRGLGLATSYSIVSRHGGSIQVESDVGVGTTFTLYLPAGEERRAVPVAGIEKTEQKTSGTARLLIMDDEEMVRQVIREMMEAAGFEVETAADGAAALEIYRKAMEAGSRFDCVIMDMTIPGGMGGKEAVRKLLEMDPGAKAIVSSGYAEDPVMVGYGDYGFKGSVAKPFRMNLLKTEIDRVLTF